MDSSVIMWHAISEVVGLNKGKTSRLFFDFIVLAPFKAGEWFSVCTREKHFQSVLENFKRRYQYNTWTQIQYYILDLRLDQCSYQMKLNRPIVWLSWQLSRTMVFYLSSYSSLFIDRRNSGHQPSYAKSSSPHMQEPLKKSCNKIRFQIESSIFLNSTHKFNVDLVQKRPKSCH